MIRGFTFPQSNNIALPLGVKPLPPSSQANEYFERILALNPLVYYPLWDSSGTSAENAEGTAAYNGTYYNASGDPPTLGVEGIGDGNTAIRFNSDGGVMTFYTDNLRDALSTTTLTFCGFNAVNSAGVWTDSTARRLLKYATGNDNRLLWGRTTTNNQLQLEFYADGTQYLINHSSFSPSSWFHWAIVINKPNAGSNGVLQLWINGVQSGNNVTLTTNFSGLLENVNAVIGADNVFGAFNWHGTAAHFAIFNTVLTEEQIVQISAL